MAERSSEMRPASNSLRDNNRCSKAAKAEVNPQIPGWTIHGRPKFPLAFAGVAFATCLSPRD